MKILFCDLLFEYGNRHVDNSMISLMTKNHDVYLLMNDDFIADKSIINSNLKILGNKFSNRPKGVVSTAFQILRRMRLAAKYARELNLVGGTLEYYNLKEEQDFRLDISDLTDTLKSDIDLLIICNPNNPTSSAISTADMKKLLTVCRSLGIFVMIDETYIEFAPESTSLSAVSLVPEFDNFMVIRGVSKFFAAPGLRFGYGLTSNQAFLQTLLTHQNPWSLNSIGAYAGERMLKDTDYIKKTWTLIDSERTRMCTELSGLDTVKIYPAYANFVLVRILKEGLTSFDVFEKAIHQNLMIRDCSSFESLNGEYVRFCIMNPEDNDRLLDVFRSL